MNEWAASPHENRDKIGYLPAYTCNKRSTLRRRGCRHAAGSTHLDPVCSAADLSPYCLDAFHFAVDDLGPGDALDAFLIEVQPVLWACAGSAQWGACRVHGRRTVRVRGRQCSVRAKIARSRDHGLRPRHEPAQLDVRVVHAFRTEVPASQKVDRRL